MAYLGSIFVVLSNDGLLSCESAWGDDDNSAGLETKVKDVLTFFPLVAINNISIIKI